MNFASDNWAGAHRTISERLVAESGQYWTPYGESSLDHQVEQRLSKLFERDVKVFFVATGTAANSLALASVKKTGGVIFCHADAHIIHHEGGAVEFMTGGAKLVPVSGSVEGKMDPASLEKAMARFPDGDVHVGQKMALSITQATEAGTIHSLDEIRALSTIASNAGLKVHMDGARFSNAIAALGCTPAEMTWKSGIDILSLGGTKNGCWCAEAIVFFDTDLADMPHLRKRGANLFSKSTFVSAQFDEWLKDDLWLTLARHSNAMAQTLADAVKASRASRLAWDAGGNQLFIILNDDTARRMADAGVPLRTWETPDSLQGTLKNDEKIYRFVTSFATRPEDIDAVSAFL